MDSITLRILRDEHFSLTAVLRSLRMMLHRGPGEDAPQYFDAMLFYIGEVPEKEHHPKESQLLFQPMLQRVPELAQTLQRSRASTRAVRKPWATCSICCWPGS